MGHWQKGPIIWCSTTRQTAVMATPLSQCIAWSTGMLLLDTLAMAATTS